MNWIKKHWNKITVDKKIVREFGFILTGFFLVVPPLMGFLKAWLAHKPFHYWMGWPVLGVIAFVINMAAPFIMAKIFHLAMFVAGGISWVVMRVVLSIFFYLVLSPVSFTMRLLGKDILNQKIDKNATSYWHKREGQVQTERYERLF